MSIYEKTKTALEGYVKLTSYDTVYAVSDLVLEQAKLMDKLERQNDELLKKVNRLLEKANMI